MARGELTLSERPLIGITIECRHDPNDARSMGSMALNWNYAQVIADAGGAPLIIPPQTPATAVAGIIDGWLIPGGLDIDPSRFGEQAHPEAELQEPARFESEAALYRAVDRRMPVLGICYGCQFLNVVRGGTLIQHLPDVLDGSSRHAGGTEESNRIEPHSLLAETVGQDTIGGRSYHHQAIGKVGSNLRPVAWHEDGTIEAVEASDRPWMLGVQWHPERSLDDPATARLFEGFVAAAAEFRLSRREQRVAAFVEHAAPVLSGIARETAETIGTQLQGAAYTAAEELAVLAERMARLEGS